MCGRFTLSSSEDQLRDLFQLFEIPSPQKKFNIAPTDDVLIVIGEEKRKMLSATWGLIPSWSKDKTIQSATINARSESVFEKPAFKTSFKERRCLIPASGFFEWKKNGPLKQPYLYGLREDTLFAFAGIYAHWTSAEGEKILSCSILTTSANDFISPLHDRMPVILEPKDYDTWLKAPYDQNTLLDLCGPYGSQKMTSYPVNPRMNNVSFESPLALERVEVQGDLF